MERKITGWHNISSSPSPTRVNNITFEDISTIINNIKNKNEIKTLDEFKDALYNHIVDTNNPHKVTMDQLPEQVIDLFYERWLQEGYTGTKQYFIDLLFRYIVTATWEEMIAGVSEEIVPTVKIFYDYLQKHNSNIIDIHDVILSRMFVGTASIAPPIIALDQTFGVPSLYTRKVADTLNMYADVPLDVGYFPSKFTILLHGRYESGTWMVLKGKNKVIYYTIEVDTTANTVTFTYKDVNTSKVSLVISTEPLLEEISNNANKLTCMWVIDEDTLYGYAQLRGNYMKIPINSTIAEVNNTIYRYPKAVRPPKDAHISIPRMSSGDMLENFICYSDAIHGDDLIFVFNIFD